MPFRCPQCQTINSLEIESSIELPPDRQSEEISLQVVSCAACVFSAVAVYSESRGSCPECESWRHTGYWISPDAVESVRQAIGSCPDLQNRRCNCPAHISLGATDYRGMWKGLLEMERGHTFSMRIFYG